MVSPRTTWDPRSEMAANAVEGMAAEPQPEPRRIIILSCGHWDHLPINEHAYLQEMAYCVRDRQSVRVLQVCDLL